MRYYFNFRTLYNVCNITYLFSYTVPVEGMDMNTVQRCSYKLVEPKKKLPTPWAEKLEYCKPDDAVECCTVYNYR